MRFVQSEHFDGFCNKNRCFCVKCTFCTNKTIRTVKQKFVKGVVLYESKKRRNNNS